jgi:hypothetical protein
MNVEASLLQLFNRGGSMSDSKVIDLSEHFLKMHPAPRSVVLQEDLAARIISEALSKCEQLGIAPEVVVSASCALVLCIAVENDWSRQTQLDLLPPVLTKSFGLLKDDTPY